MRNLANVNNPYSDDKVISNCSIFGLMNTDGGKCSGVDVMTAIANMHDRGNGLGGGMAAYGIYPDNKDCYALHVMYTSKSGKESTEKFLQDNFHIIRDEEVPTRKQPEIKDEPLVWRYFTKPIHSRLDKLNEDDFVVDRVMKINTVIEDSFVFSSGKDMGVFKGVGFPEEIARYFCLDDYEGYIWTAHGRFPTNTNAWWGGAHPFSLLDWTVVHNGEISSYGINRRFLEMYGYHCTMHTDTEVIAYAVDLLMRKQKLPVELFADVLASPLWAEIDQMTEEDKKVRTALRQVYGSLLMNGPFAIIVAHEGEVIALTDRVRLRPMVAATKGKTLYMSSEEAAIRLISPQLDQLWVPMGGEPVIGRLGHLPKPSREMAKASAV